MRGSAVLARSTLLVMGLTLAACVAGASVAGATAPGTNRIYNLPGACNMTNSDAGYGMFTFSQSVANPHGWDEGAALNNSTGGNPPENCGRPSQPPPRP